MEMLSSRVVASFFEPSTSCIIEAIKVQKRTAHFPIEVSDLFISFYKAADLCKSVFLVGGFSASSWLFEKVRNAIEPLGIGVFRPDNHVYVLVPKDSRPCN